MSLLQIKNLSVSVGDEKILNNLSLTINAGEVHAIMGPNGSGKSTLSYVLSGREGYEILEGEIIFKGQSILDLEADERSRLGMFLAFQYPIELPGVTSMNFLKTMINSIRKAKGLKDLDGLEIVKLVKEKSKQLDISSDMLKRFVNVGFSGGEKKRFEILQMSLLEPELAVLDETDSGLDIDALRIVGKGVTGLRNNERSMLVITHYQRLLDYIVPDFVHILANGKIYESGGPELAKIVEKEGYKRYTDAA
tara:strand:- start:135 stop:887 length:753 start_codon:yes stop_codon:yes gene_type:complete